MTSDTPHQGSPLDNMPLDSRFDHAARSAHAASLAHLSPRVQAQLALRRRAALSQDPRRAAPRAWPMLALGSAAALRSRSVCSCCAAAMATNCRPRQAPWSLRLPQAHSPSPAPRRTAVQLRTQAIATRANRSTPLRRRRTTTQQTSPPLLRTT